MLTRYPLLVAAVFFTLFGSVLLHLFHFLGLFRLGRVVDFLDRRSWLSPRLSNARRSFRVQPFVTPRAFYGQDTITETTMRFIQIETLPTGKALVDIDKLTHAVPEGEGSRLFLGAQHIDVPHSLSELENVLAGRDRTDDGENSRAGFGVR
jgi:hypothetical protein